MYRFFASLFILFLAPACAPAEPPPPTTRALATVVLTDTTIWQKEELAALRDSLEGAGNRLVISGYSGETPADLVARLPWLLQPGTGRILYDERLAGPAAADSLRALLSRLERDVPVVVLHR